MTGVQITVTDRATGAPIDAAHVGVFLAYDVPAGGGEGDRRVVLLQGTTGVTGECIVPVDLGLAERAEVRAVVRARGHEEWRAPQFAMRRGPGAAPPAPPVLTADTIVRIDVALERGTTIGGTVTDPSGRPVARAAIGLVLSLPIGCSWPYAFAAGPSAHWPPPCQTDEHGRFEWLSFPIHYATNESGGHYVLMAQHDDFAPAMLHSVEALPTGADGVIDVSLTVAPGRSFEGEILDPSGAPASGAIVTLTAEPDAEQPFCISFDKTATTGADGRFSMRGLKRTTHRMAVEMAGCAPSSMNVDLAQSEPEPCLVRLLGGSDLDGEVLDRHGAPIADARIFAFMREPRFMRETNTDAAGRFRIVGLPATGEVNVRCVGRAIEVDVALPSPPLTLRAPSNAELHAHVVADESGEPLGPGRVTLFGPGFSTALDVDAAGSIHRADLPAGRYRIVADIPGRAVAEAPFDLTPDGPHAPIVVRVAKGGAVRGTVTDAAGRPLANVRVALFSPGSAHARGKVTDDAGAYVIRGLGEWAHVVFAAEGLALRACPVQPTGSWEDPVTLDVTMSTGATVTGRVVRADGSAVVRARVTIAFPERRHAPFELPSTLSDQDGRFVLHHVPPGELVVATGPAVVNIQPTHGATIDVLLAVE